MSVCVCCALFDTCSIGHLAGFLVLGCFHCFWERLELELTEDLQTRQHGGTAGRAKTPVGCQLAVLGAALSDGAPRCPFFALKKAAPVITFAV